MTVQDCGEDFKPNVVGHLNAHSFLILTNMLTKLSTPSVLFSFDESYKEVKTPKKIITVRNPAAFLEDNPNYFGNAKEIGVIPCYKFESAPSDKEKLHEFSKFKKELKEITEA